jgi:hypothetical protein
MNADSWCKDWVEPPFGSFWAILSWGMLHTHIAIIYNDDIRVIDYIYIYTYIHIQLYIYIYACTIFLHIDWLGFWADPCHRGTELGSRMQSLEAWKIWENDGIWWSTIEILGYQFSDLSCLSFKKNIIYSTSIEDLHHAISIHSTIPLALWPGNVAGQWESPWN